MVLKRKRNNEFIPFVPAPQSTTLVAANSLPQEQPQHVEEAEPVMKRTRGNPSRTATGIKPAIVPSTTKKARGGRGKKAALPADAPVSSSIPQAGPSTVLVPTSAPAAAKKSRGKKKADPNAESGSVQQAEKRGAVFKPKCPQAILDRVERVNSQRIFMIDRQRNEGELHEEFSVLGSTGNVYKVTIDKTPRCNCPDACKGNHCKHILFVFLKVLQVRRDSGYWYQKALLTSELEEIFAQAPLAPNSVAHPHVREAYARVTGKLPTDVPSTKLNRRVPGPDDDCPICYDGMHGIAEARLIFCEECGNALHKECFSQWQKTAKVNGKELTCVWCRAKWSVVAAGIGGSKTPTISRTMNGHGYLNLAGVSGQSPVRDTSTYYHGPRSGQRYHGYQNYDFM